MKPCTRCRITKPLAEFGFSRGSHIARCKACVRELSAYYHGLRKYGRRGHRPEANPELRSRGEVARILGITAEGVRVIEIRALEKIRRALGRSS